jgi:hypothetical protein
MSMPRDARKRDWKMAAKAAWILVIWLLDMSTLMRQTTRPEVVRSARMVET